MAGPAYASTVVDRVLTREGSTFVNAANDLGGPTKYGITIPFLEDLRGAPQTAADIQKLTDGDARLLYYVWMQRTQLAALPILFLMDAVTDYAVHSGLGAGVEALERALGTAVDGAIGPNDLAACAQSDQPTVARLVCADRLERWQRIFAGDPSQCAFASDWLGRLAGVLRG